MAGAFSAVGGVFGSVMGSIIGGTESRDELETPLRAVRCFGCAV